jgi:uncharacterized repeat protein (TIGR01451 family)
MKILLRILFLFCLVFGKTGSTTAQIVQPFTVYKQLTQRGDITFAANTVLTCSGACTEKNNPPPGSGQPPTGGAIANNALWNNNNFQMAYVDADGTPAFGGKTTFNSSRAFLDLSNNPGCSVIEAFLTWGGNILSTTPNYSKRDSVYVKVPGATTNYTGYKADYIIDNTAGGVGGAQISYQCYKNITNQVRSAGEGDYWVGNIIADIATTSNTCGGWAIVVIYGDETLPLRNLTIYKGYANISSATGGQNLSISGFYTPPAVAAAVNVKLGVFSFEGDQGTIGDTLKFNGTGSFLPVTDALNYQNNFFNSSIDIGGISVNGATALHPGNPTYLNTLGFDADIVTLANGTKTFLGNGASSATLRLTTAGDQYWPFMLTTAIDVFEPNVFVVKDWVDDDGGLVQLGDVITYNLKVYNKGTDPASNMELVDSLYGAMDYVPNSCQILTGANAGPKTDFIGDDQVDVNGNVIKFRLGKNANGTTGGLMGITAASDSLTTVTFKVKITSDCQIFKCRDSVLNKAYANFIGQTSGQGRSTLSSPNGLDAFGCPIQGATVLRVVVPACTPVADTTVSVFCEPYALSGITVNRPGYSSFFNSSWSSVTNATANGTYYAIKQFYPGCFDTIAITFSSTGNCLLLPVNLKDISANYINEKGRISWTTSTETNTLKFIVERSQDGASFLPIGSVAANGNSNQAVNYQFEDAVLPDAKKVYYRILIIDRDGSEKISKIVFIYTRGALVDAEILQVVPNPVTDRSVVRIYSKTNSKYQYALINSMGQKTVTQTVSFTEGNNEITIFKNQLPKGIYVFKLTKLNQPESLIKTMMIQ